jgi:Mrp family chromosome partitioning ATPase
MLAEIKRLLAAARKWGWLAVLSMVLTVSMIVVNVALTPPTYIATATIKVSIQNPLNADYINLLGGERLVQSYIPILTSASVLGPVVQQYPQVSQSQLAPAIAAAIPSDSAGQAVAPILQISVSASSAALAASLANAVVDSLISYEEAVNDLYAPQRLQAIDADLAQMHDAIHALNAQLAQAKASGASAAQIQSLQIALTGAQGQEATLSGIQQGVQTRMDQIQKDFSVLAPATAPAAPVDQHIVQHLLEGVLVGLLAAFALAAIFETLADKARTVSLIERWLRPVLGVIPPEDFATLVTPEIMTPSAQAYRALRARLGMAAGPLGSNVLLVVSVAPDHDTAAWVASNLALLQASSGRQVLLVDGLLDRPLLDQIFEVPNERGFSNSLMDLRHDPQGGLTSLHSVAVAPGVALVTAGPPPLDTSDLLDSTALVRFIAAARLRQIDQVIVVGPPVLGSINATLLGSQADAVLVTVDSSQTTVEQVERAAALLQRGRLPVLGVAMCLSDASLGVVPRPVEAAASSASTPISQDTDPRAPPVASDTASMRASYQPAVSVPPHTSGLSASPANNSEH